MQQLGANDATFANLETAANPQHISGFGLYDPSTAPGGFVRFKQLIAAFEKRLHHLPLFRTRLVEVPGGIDKPYWVKDENFDVEFHVRHIGLPHPGDWRQLCITVARLHSRPVDMARPLWEVYIIEGLDKIPNLPKGSFGIFFKIHHCLVDGGGSEAIMAALHDLEPNPPAEVKSPEKILVDYQPGAMELVARAAINNIKNTYTMTRGAIGTASQFSKIAYKVARKKIPMPVLGGAETRFNRPVSPHRIFTARAYPLDDIKAIKNAAGTTVNDVGVAIIAGALRRYLEHHGELPEESLVATMPVNMRHRIGDTGEHNQIRTIYGRIYTDIEDPIERLQAINVGNNEAKEFGIDNPLASAMTLPGTLNPFISKTAARIYSNQKLTRLLPSKSAAIISNVPGPNFPLYCSGAKLVHYYGMGIVTPGIGLFNLISSYNGEVTVSTTADRQAVPDPDFFSECVEESYQELKAAAANLAVAESERQKKKKAVKQSRADD